MHSFRGENRLKLSRGIRVPKGHLLSKLPPKEYNFPKKMGGKKEWGIRLKFLRSYEFPRSCVPTGVKTP